MVIGRNGERLSVTMENIPVLKKLLDLSLDFFYIKSLKGSQMSPNLVTNLATLSVI